MATGYESGSGATGRVERQIGAVSLAPGGGEIVMTGANKRIGSAICILDDDPSVLKSTGRLLSSAGWNVQPFADPHSFLNYARMHRPRLAVIDMAMPLMHGLEVQRRLRQISPATKVVVLTANDDPVICSSAIDAGAANVLIKPVGDEEFLSGVESALNGSSIPSNEAAA
jgi:two-component system response regulator HydG